jgi:peptide/nickel transport system substrate-binding protein
VSQLLTGHSRSIRLFVATLLVAGAGCRATPTSNKGSAAQSGGELRVSIRTEPRNFTRLEAREETTDLVALLIHASLIRINRTTDEVEPWLAESWTRSPDGRQFTIRLRPNVQFSDGHALSSDDVVFSFEAAYATGADTLRIDGKRLAVAAVDPLTVSLTFPQPFAPGLRILDSLIVLPRHKLEAALKNGTLQTAWGLSTPPSELAGLGPFVLSSYQPGQRLVFVRNPHYWRRDDSGTPLPYLDRVTLDVVPDQSTQLLRLESGDTDATPSAMPAEAYASLKQGADAGKLRLYDLGPALFPDWLGFNLKPGAFAGDPRAPWLQRQELRQAISLAVDRTLFVDTVFLGAAVPVFGPVSPANAHWYWTGTPAIPHDPDRAKKLLASIGITPDHPAHFTILTMKGRPSFERAVAVIRDELRKVNVMVDVAALEGNALIQQILSGHYDTVYFQFSLTDTDPAMSADFWPSSGTEHFWNREQKTPATAWEARIDDLFRAQSAAADAAQRKQLFDEVQSVFVGEQPFIYFAAPRVFVVTSTRVGNVAPSAGAQIPPRLLWSPDTLTVTSR